MLARALVIALLGACGGSQLAAPVARWVEPRDMGPTGVAPNAKHRVLATYPDGTRDMVLILATGDEVMTAIKELATREAFAAARFTAIGAIREGEVAFFDFGRKQYKGLRLVEQLEMVTMTGDVALDKDGNISVHAHAVLGREDGSTIGGHVIGAVAKPTLEVFLTTYPQPLQKRLLEESNSQVIDL